MSGVEAAPVTTGRAELRLAGHALAVLGVLAVPLLGGVAVWNGVPGVAGAAAGLGLVAVLFGAAGLAQGIGARRAPSRAPAVAAAGFAVRLGVYLVALQALGQVAWLHRPSLAIATAIGFVVTLFEEVRLISRSPEMFRFDPDRSMRGRDGAAAADPASRKRS